MRYVEAYYRKIETLKKKQMKILELKNITSEDITFINITFSRHVQGILEMIEESVNSQVNQYKLPNLSKLSKNRKGKKT